MDFNTITFPNWYRNFPEWWQEDKFLDAIGYFISELGYYYAYSLLTAKLEQPIEVWLDAQEKEDIYQKTYNFNYIPFEYILPAPLYKTKGSIELIFNCDKALDNVTIMINDVNGISLPFSIKSGTLLIDIDNQRYYYNDEEVDVNKIGKGIQYFETSQHYTLNTNEAKEIVPLHNECVRLSITCDNYADLYWNEYQRLESTFNTIFGAKNLTEEVFKKELDNILHSDNRDKLSATNVINIETNVTMNRPVFTVEQNIKIATLSVLPIQEVKLYVFYDTPFNSNIQGWRYVWHKQYPNDARITYDRLTKQFYAKKFYFVVSFYGLDLSIPCGFPQESAIEDITNPFHMNTHLDKWGQLYGLSRRTYKEDIDEYDYYNTLPPYYPYIDEQDYWYERRLINEYVWNMDNIDNVFLKDTELTNIISLQDIDPYIEDLVIHAGSRLPNNEKTENKITAKPANLIQYSTSGTYKQTPFEDIENLLDDDDSKPMSLMLNQYYNQNISDETFRSYLVNILFDLSELPEDVLITGFEFLLDAEASNNSDNKYNDIRTNIYTNNRIGYDYFIPDEKYDPDVNYQPLMGFYRPDRKATSDKEDSGYCNYCIYDDTYTEYRDYYKTWVNYCPHCDTYGSLQSVECKQDDLLTHGHLYCSKCNSRYCGFCGNLDGHIKTTIDKKTNTYIRVTEPADYGIGTYKLKQGTYVSHIQSINESDSFDKERKTITYGYNEQKYGFEDTISNGIESVDLRDYLVENGIHFGFGVTNTDQQQDCIINIYNIKLNVYYKKKTNKYTLTTNLLQTNNDNATLDVTVSNTGSINLTTDVNVITTPLLTLSPSIQKPYKYTFSTDNLKPNDAISKSITVARGTSTIPDGSYDIFVNCGDKEKHEYLKLDSSGRIETQSYIKSAYSYFNNDNVKVTDLKIYVTAEDNIAINDGVVKVYIDDYLVKQNGLYEFNVKDSKVELTNIPIPENLAGLYQIKVKYLGTSKYATSNYVNTILISKEDTVTTISDISPVKQGAEFTLTAKVLTEKNQNVTEGQMYFYIVQDGKEEEIGHTNVDSTTSIAKLITSLPYATIGEYKIIARYRGTVAFGASQDETTLNIIGGDVNLFAFDYDVITGDIVHIAAKLLDMINRPVVSGTVDFYLDDVLIPGGNDVQINENGIASFIYNVSDSLIPDGTTPPITYTLKVVYKPDIDNTYNPITETSTFRVDLLYTSVVTNDINATQGQTLGFICQVLTSNQVPAKQGTVDIYIDDLGTEPIASAEVDKYGYAKILYNTLSLTYEEWLELSKYAFKQDIQYATEEGAGLPALMVDDLYAIYDASSNEELTSLMMNKRSFSIEDGNLYVTLPSGDNTEVFILENGNLYIKKDKITESELLNNQYTYTAKYHSKLKYKSSEKTGTIIMNPKTDYLMSLLKYNQEYGNTVDIETTIEGNNEGVVKFFIDNDKIGETAIQSREINTDKTDPTKLETEYYATVSNYLINRPPSRYIIRAEHWINDEINCIVYNVLIISKIIPTLHLDINRVFAGVDSNLSSWITFDNGLNILQPTGEVSISLDGEEHFYHDITKLNDKIIDVIKMPDNFKNNHAITATYTGDDYVEPATAELKLIPTQLPTTIKFDSQKIARGNTCTLTVSVSANDDDVINEGYINLRSDLFGSLDPESTIDDKNINVKNGTATFVFDINKQQELKTYQLQVRYLGGLNYTDSAMTLKQLIVIDEMDEVYIANQDINDNSHNVIGNDVEGAGTKESPFATINQALQCIKNNGTINILKGVYEVQDIVFKKDITIIGENDVILKQKNDKQLNITIMQGHSVIINNMSFDNIYEYDFIINGSTVGKDKGALSFNKCILGHNVNINNINGFLYINQSTVLCTLSGNIGTYVLDNNWWGTNEPNTFVQAHTDNWVTTEISTSLNKQATVGDVFTVNVDFINNKSHDIYPQRAVTMTSEQGEYSLYTGMLINNHFETTYSNALSNTLLYATVDDQVLELSIEDYIKNVEVKMQNIETPIGYETPIYALVVNADNKLIDSGIVEFYLNDKLIRTIEVNDGIAEFSIYLDENYTIDTTYNWVAKYHTIDKKYNAEVNSIMKVIADSDICFVADVEKSGTGSFKYPFNNMRAALSSNASTIYVKSGIYNDNDWLINRDVTIKAYSDDVVFNGGEKILSTQNKVTIDGVQFINYLGTTDLINNVGTLIFNNTLFYQNQSYTTDADNIKTYKNIIYNEGNLEINNCAIVNNSNKFIDNVGTATAEYNWWGVDAPDFTKLLNNVTVKYWICMDFITKIDPVNMGTTPTLIASLNHYTDGKEVYKLSTQFLPSRKGIFAIKTESINKEKGSLTPLIDYTDISNNAKTLYNSNEDANTFFVKLELADNTNYYNDDKITFKCYAHNYYGDPINQGDITFYIDGDELNTRQTLSGVSELTINNINLELGTHKIVAVYKDTTNYIYQSATIEGTFEIKLTPIILKNINITSTIFGLKLQADAEDNLGNSIVSEDIKLYLDDKEIIEYIGANTVKYKINNGKINEHVVYGKTEAGKHQLKITANPKTTYDTLNTIVSFNIALSPTNISYINTDSKILFFPETYSKDLVFNIQDETGINITDGTVDVYQDDKLLTQNPIHTTDGIIEIDNSILDKNNRIRQLTFIYKGDNHYYASSIQKFTINYGIYNVNIDGDAIVCQYGDDININATITNLDGDIVDSGLVSIYKTDINTKIDEPIIEHISCTGHISQKYNIHCPAGNYYIKLVYTNNENEYAQTETNILLSVYPRTVMFNSNNKISTISNVNIEETLDISSTKNITVNNGLVVAYLKNGKEYTKISTVPKNKENVYNDKITIDLNIPKLEIGSYIIKLEYINNNYFGNPEATAVDDNISQEIILTIHANETNITFNNTECYPIENNFQVNIIDSLRRNVMHGIVSFYQDGKKISECEVVDGIGKYILYPAEVRDITLIAKYVDSENVYSGSSATQEIKVNKIPIKSITSEDINVVNGETVKLHYDIESDIGQVEDGQLDIVINDQKVASTYISNNAGTLEFDVPLLAPDTYTMYFRYHDSKIYADTELLVNHNTFIVEKKDIIISMESIIASVNETITLNPKFDRKLDGVAYCYILDKFIDVVSLDNQDNFTLTYKLPDDTKSTDNKITIKFSGNKYYNQTSATFDLIINQETSTISLEAISANVGNTITFNSTTTLPDNKRVDFYIENVIVTEGIVKDGKASATYILPYSKTKNTYKIYAKFSGSAIYVPIEANNTLTINPANIKDITFDTLDGYKAGALTINPTVIDENNNIVDEGRVSIGSDSIAINTTYSTILSDNPESNVIVSYNPENTDKFNTYSENDTLNLLLNDFTTSVVNDFTYTIGDYIDSPVTFIHPTTTNKINTAVTYQILNNDEVLFEKELINTDGNYQIQYYIPSNIYPGTYTTRYYIADNGVFNKYGGYGQITINSSDIIYVDNTKETQNYGNQENPMTSLLEAIKHLKNNGVIYLTGIYNEPIIIDRDLTINGNTATLQGNNDEPIITNNNNLTLNNVTLENNTSNTLSAGIINNKTLEVQNCQFNKLISSGTNFGGAIYSNGTIIVNQSTFNGNHGYAGGAIYLARQSLNSQITNCTFNSNISEYNGGAIYSYNADNLNITNNSFIMNVCNNKGGAIYITGNGNILQNLFQKNHTNSASSYGGAIAMVDGTVTTEYNIFESNTYYNDTNINEIYKNTGINDLAYNYFGNKYSKNDIMTHLNGEFNMTTWATITSSTNPSPAIINSEIEIDLMFKIEDEKSTYDAQKSFHDYAVNLNATNGTFTPTVSVIKNNHCTTKFISDTPTTIKLGDIDIIEVKE